MKSNIQKKQIIFIESLFTIPVFKLARILRLTGRYKTILISFSKIEEDTRQFLNDAYDEIITLDVGDIRNIGIKNLFRVFKLLRSKDKVRFVEKIKTLNPYMIQITGLDLVTCIVSKLFFKNIPKVYFAHDIWRYYYVDNWSKGIFTNRMAELYGFNNMDGILYKWDNDSLKSFKMKHNSPAMQYLSGCMDEWIVNKTKDKLSNKDNELHIGYAGGIWKETYGHRSFLPLIEELSSQKIHLHVFCPYPHWKEINNYFGSIKSKYFHWHDTLRGKELNKELSRMDYGLIFDYINPLKIRKEFMDGVLSTKMFAYLESGIPTVVSDDLKFTSKLITNNNIGLSIKYEDIKNIKKILSSLSYNSFSKNLKKAQNKFRMTHQINKIEKFYDVVHNNFKK